MESVAIGRFLLQNGYEKIEENDKEMYVKYRTKLYSSIYLYVKERTLHVRSRYVHGDEAIEALIDIEEIYSIQCYTKVVQSGYSSIRREVIMFHFKDGSALEVRK